MQRQSTTLHSLYPKLHSTTHPGRKLGPSNSEPNRCTRASRIPKPAANFSEIICEFLSWVLPSKCLSYSPRGSSRRGSRRAGGCQGAAICRTLSYRSITSQQRSRKRARRSHVSASSDEECMLRTALRDATGAHQRGWAIIAQRPYQHGASDIF